MNKTIAVVCAMNSEAKPLLDRMENLESKSIDNFEFFCGKINSNKILVCVSGVKSKILILSYPTFSSLVPILLNSGRFHIFPFYKISFKS